MKEEILQLKERVVSECNRLNAIIRERDLRIAQLEEFVDAVANHALPGWDLRAKAKELLAKGGQE